MQDKKTKQFKYQLKWKKFNLCFRFCRFVYFIFLTNFILFCFKIAGFRIIEISYDFLRMISHIPETLDLKSKIKKSQKISRAYYGQIKQKYTFYRLNLNRDGSFVIKTKLFHFCYFRFSFKKLKIIFSKMKFYLQQTIYLMINYKNYNNKQKK